MANATERILFFDKYKMKRRDKIRYLVIEPEDLKIRYEKKNPPDKTRRHPDNYLPKEWSKKLKKYWQKKKVLSVFLTREYIYCFMKSNLN